jgi:antitoxin component YwqK of YwqJK toxin-antitoxin module
LVNKLKEKLRWKILIIFAAKMNTMNLFKISFLSVIILLSSCNFKDKAARNSQLSNDSTVVVKLNTSQVAPMEEEGLNTDYYDNGKERMKGIIKNGKREGLWQAWYENGNLWSEAEYRNGINHGKTITYFENGKIRYEGKFEEGNKIGVWKYYDDSGNLVKSIPN